MTGRRCSRASCTPSCSGHTRRGAIYDLLWYLSDPQWPSPNLTLLNNALQQTGWPGPELTAETWREAVCRRLEALDWSHVTADVRPFLESGADVGLLRLDNLVWVLENQVSAQ
jgi:hypothetical protein